MTLTVPVTIVTACISSAADWQSYIVMQSGTDAVDGYFVLTNDIVTSDIGAPAAVKPSAINNNMQVGFLGTLDGRGRTVTIQNGGNTGLGLFGVLGSGAVVKNLTIINNSGKAPGYNSNATLAVVATGATLKNVAVEINGANHTSGARYGALTQEGIVSCKFIGVTVNINGKVQSLSGGGNPVLSLKETNFTDCVINLLTETSSLDEVGHNGSTVFLAKGAAAINGESVLSGIVLRKAGVGAYLVKNGESSYSVMKPKGASATLNKAAEELVRYFGEATGYTLTVVDDSSGLSHGALQTYISLGETSLYDTAGIEGSFEKSNGAYIYTKDCNIYITGGSDKGVLYGVYELLAELFGLEFYSADCYTITEGIEDLLRPDFSKAYNPTIDLCGQTGIVLGTEEKYTAYADHIRSTDYVWAYLMPIVSAADETKTNYGHNSLYYLPAETYKESHPHFYSDRSTWDANSWGGINAQLCFTAHGDEEEYAEMVSLCAQRIEASLVKYASNTVYDAVMLGIEDNYFMCNCAACTSVKNRYGAISATVILFLDDVAAQVEAWMNEHTEYKRELQYMFFAYQECLPAPSVMPAVSHRIAPLVAMSEMDYSVSPTDTTERSTRIGVTSNKAILEYAEQWGDFAAKNGAKAWAWTYGNFFRDYFCFYDSYAFYADIFGYLGEYGYDLVYVQQQSAQRNAYTAFYSLNQYVTSKLSRDASLSMETLIDNYMNAMYKDAAADMKSLFGLCRTSFQENGLNVLVLGAEKPGAKLTEACIRQMFACLDDAYSAISKYETSDPELYAAIKARIDAEWLAPAKIALVDLKESFRNAADYNEIRSKFLALVEETGITAASEFDKDMSALLSAV